MTINQSYSCEATWSISFRRYHSARVWSRSWMAIYSYCGVSSGRCSRWSSSAGQWSGCAIALCLDSLYKAIRESQKVEWTTGFRSYSLRWASSNHLHLPLDRLPVGLLPTLLPLWASNTRMMLSCTPTVSSGESSGWLEPRSWEKPSWIYSIIDVEEMVCCHHDRYLLHPSCRHCCCRCYHHHRRRHLARVSVAAQPNTNNRFLFS